MSFQYIIIAFSVCARAHLFISMTIIEMVHIDSNLFRFLLTDNETCFINVRFDAYFPVYLLAFNVVQRLLEYSGITYYFCPVNVTDILRI